ncbi:hypothetical protein M413DRAFT_441214 [Hebeloma cylindrosporum]|uniref:Uncharacterized protein n=1 Tax=Hebeloma cylindrosporum TaxID=76867 RepID=A0A0C2Y8J9_HEBCY|nr:hypothetical protein M413DRAFT_441214 [Hebeloma cylindrosporum h7]
MSLSKLTASPFHKPSPFEFPRPPPSPPETNSDTVAAGIGVLPSAGALHDYGSPDTTNPLRKSSSIPYHNSGFRESKDRATQRTSKPLIIVIPPSTLIHEHGLGQTASNGPYHRVSHGVVMPLFPSIFGQLTAIAREFNFPSTSGLCLYLHFVEGEVTTTPRISDDSWQTLWAYLSEPSPPNGRRALIAGKIEFDIDLRLARWYSVWVSSLHREISDYAGHYYPSTAPSMIHFRADSRATVADRRSYDDDGGENIHQQSAPITRHVPRKLSLVERFDVSSSRPDIKPTPRVLENPPEKIPSGSQILSTIVQEDEPKTAKQDLKIRVKSWREGAVVTPTHLAASGQTSLDPANLPNHLFLETLVSSPTADEVELKLEDYTWSVSSLGPPSFGDVSPPPCSLAPSVHLANRLEGSVCTTPSAHSSSGPLNDEIYWPASPFTHSVHLASRLEGSFCSTPSICTSSGPSDHEAHWPSSPFLRIPSPDIAQRMYEAIPDTPTTATSWGALLSYPPSPRCASPNPSLDLGERSMSLEFGPPKVYPRSDATSGSLDGVQTGSDIWGGKPWSHIWPYNDGHASRASPIRHRPSIVETHKLTEDKAVVQSAFGYPYLTIYKPLYPHLDIYPSPPCTLRSAFEANSEDWTVYPHNLDHLYPCIGLSQENIVRDMEDYPLFNLYPSITQIASSHSAAYMSPDSFSEIPHLPGYPTFNIYPAVYPYFNLYPDIHNGGGLSSVDPRDYSHFETYPALADEIDHDKDEMSLATTPPPSYPYFNLYPSMYPYVEIYPIAYFPRKDVPGPSLPRNGDRPNERVSAYPYFNLYPSLYPYFDLYPAPYGSRSMLDPSPGRKPNNDKESLSPVLCAGYPSFRLYTSVYPNFDLYPGPYWSMKDVSLRGDANALPALNIRTGYPSFNLYSSIYPFFDLYPTTGSAVQPPPPVNVAPQPKYPHFKLYPAVYPNFDLYLPLPNAPVVQSQRMTRSGSRLTHLELHAMVMMERSFGPIDPTNGLREKSYQIPMTEEDEGVRQLPRSSSLRASGTGKLPLTTKPGVNTPVQTIETIFSSKTSTPRESRPSSILESSNSRAFRGSPVRTASLRRESLVLQRVRAFDNNYENPLEIHKETVSRFPKPPKVPPAPLPMERGRQ